MAVNQSTLPRPFACSGHAPALPSNKTAGRVNTRGAGHWRTGLLRLLQRAPLTQPSWVYYISCMARFVRKSVFVDPTALRRAQKILRTPTESETICEALNLVAFRRSVLKEYDRVAGKAPDFPDPRTDA